MNRLYVVLVLLLGWARPSQSQPANLYLDSLTHRLTATPADTNRVRLLEQLAKATAGENSAQALRYGQQGLQLARQLHDAYGEATLLNQLADNYFRQTDLVAAVRYYQQVVRRAKDLPRAQRLLTRALLGLGRIASLQQDFVGAQQYFQQALQQLQRPQYRAEPEELGVAHNNLGMFYLSWLQSGRPYPDSTKRLCLYHTRLALTILRTTRLPKANMAQYLNSLGLVHAFYQQIDSAYYYHRSALRLFQRAGKSYGIVVTRIFIGNLMLEQRRFADALAVTQPALPIARQLNLNSLVVGCLNIIADALAALGRGNEAFPLAKRAHELRDSLNLVEREANLSRLRLQFDTELERSRVRELTNRNQLQELQARKQRQYLWGLSSFLVAVVAGLVVAGVLAGRLRRQRTELQATRAEQDRLYALIAHDLRSPVMAFGGLADLLTTYSERQDTMRLLRLGGRVRQAAESLRALLDNLLNWALSQRGELRPVPEPLRVADLLAEIVTLYQPSAHTAGIALEVPPATEEQLVQADRNMTLTILRNLVNNALQATPAGGRITVSVADADAHQLQLAVADTGPGMDAPELRLVMSDQPLPAAGPYRGRAGLGLRLSRLFARLQGGQLDLRSKPSQGTTATLSLPRPGQPAGPTPRG
ncbi:sensor histidine kinase [Hymenobacter properus]|uniref:histidine kinase n=1 Tax=Hymenobacter properus TaxID=2791026 RepID=A0A931BJ58_9BACT|nr:HAMP domain-containing sensor histidine kinase [Hymenobacter properus]MBF9143258.1 HAMP domain-containing histidine kinase [Hymenobacter properus]MBR7722068.1 HAMP domain-containing histidine kinase [Microvirga sp. SRT04]